MRQSLFWPLSWEQAQQAAAGRVSSCASWRWRRWRARMAAAPAICPRRGPAATPPNWPAWSWSPPGTAGVPEAAGKPGESALAGRVQRRRKRKRKTRTMVFCPKAGAALPAHRSGRWMQPGQLQGAGARGVPLLPADSLLRPPGCRRSQNRLVAAAAAVDRL